MTQKIQNKILAGVTDKVFPQAELLVAQRGEILLHEFAGTFNDVAKAKFDLASLTKPLCTAMLCMALYQDNKISLDDTLEHYFITHIQNQITVRHLLNHTSGLVDWVPFYANMIFQKNANYAQNNQKILDLILLDDNMDRYPQKTHYSDIGYILLGALIERAGNLPLTELFKKYIADPLNISDRMFFVPVNEKQSAYKKEDFVPTVDCLLRQRLIQGEVMDRNCYVMGGVSGHAGLFSDAFTIHRVLNELRLAKLAKSTLIQKKTFDLFCLPDLKRVWDDYYFTLGFDTSTRSVSQSGTLFSKNTIGHLGYAGTSFWWDIERDFWVILLTNRCMPDRKNTKIRSFRPELHDLIVRELAL
ncbi:hypothetical protein BVY03_05175 [bacterium K02(2017)]|nr:hypothetical protein BVY03_05175 [bacterium K02(2017)]